MNKMALTETPKRQAVSGNDEQLLLRKKFDLRAVCHSLIKEEAHLRR